jgi:alpha-amylase
VYDEGWLDQFFSAIEQERSWLSTSTFRDYVEAVGPDGTVYLPCGSYDEMLEWSGGHFRNFFTKYPEADAMYQKMLRVSRQLQEVSSVECRVSSSSRERRSSGRRHSSLVTRHSKLIEQARQALYTGQCNCAYWHGVFGGLYLSHLRRAVYSHLIKAEQLVDLATRAKPSVLARDADSDGREEASLKTATMSLLVDPAEGGVVTEWSLFGPRLNLLDTLARRHEPYHDKLRAKQTQAAVPAGGVPASIHDVLGVKEENLSTHLVYDDHRRSAFLDYALEGMPTLEDVVRSTWGERRLWSAGPFQWGRRGRTTPSARTLGVEMVRQITGGWIRKAIRVATDQALVEYLFELDSLHVPVVALEFNVSLRDERYLTTAQQSHHVSWFVIQEPALGVSLTVAPDPPATLFHFPIETVSESEEGLERTYQGLCLMFLWALARPGDREQRPGTHASGVPVSKAGAAGGLRGQAGDGATGRWAARVRWEVTTHPSTRLTRSGPSRATDQGR